jgi:Arc/MetJ family transcription regulator
VRTTITLDDELVARAQKLTGIKDKPNLIRAALTALIQQEAARRLAKLGGTEPDFGDPPRRRRDEAA